MGAYVRERRKLLGWTQRELADKVGVRRLWVVQFEQGKSSAQLGLALRTLKALGISLNASLHPGDSNSPRQGGQQALPRIDLAGILDSRNPPHD